MGRFELANAGTLFLDEIGDIGLDIQTKLLRVLQEKTFERVGSSDPVHVDVRIIAATHQNLEELIRQGRFREDLYYRLKVIDILVPPLRNRREDIPELALHFLAQYAQRCNRPAAQIDDDAMTHLKGYDWPGNIRQLENVMERAVVICDGPCIMPHDLPEEVAQPRVPAMSPEPAERSNGGLVTIDLSVKGTSAERAERDRRERERLVRALASTKGNKAEAARLLGLPRSTFLSRLKKHGLD
jgi:DNA-binding NtrC family response regulator